MSPGIFIFQVRNLCFTAIAMISITFKVWYFIIFRCHFHEILISQSPGESGRQRHSAAETISKKLHRARCYVVVSKFGKFISFISQHTLICINPDIVKKMCPY